ncbi:helix-turn-helix domain-containing protein [Aequorivita capsosiphonis]|uniref:helix-turn-helix domain-containing protein n=1 Tax=Aequorivita capsosiphonis TaxID=487317 RepID=UPI000404CEB5|nr:AraC family transcriptional regulator [Aequorivita capsosiphonis]
MQTIRSHSIPLKDVIQDLALQMDTPFTQNCNEFRLDIPKTLGEGSIKGIDFKDGLSLLQYDCTFREDMEIQFIIDQVHPLKFIFCEEGNLTHRFENEIKEHHMLLLENIIVASSQNNGHILQFKGGLKTIINSLEINRAAFENTVDCELHSLKNGLETLFRDVHAKEEFYHHGNYCIKMADLFIEINGFPKEDFLRRIFFEGSAFKVLTLQILQYQDDLATYENKTVLRKFELKLIREASAIIDNEILDFKTVQELANQVGINANKLQNGFKELYDTTVNNYVHNRRLDLASNLLKNSEHSISEIVYIVGLSSKSYFSKIFKDKYGLSPSTVRINGKH